MNYHTQNIHPILDCWGQKKICRGKYINAKTINEEEQGISKIHASYESSGIEKSINKGYTFHTIFYHPTPPNQS